MQKRFLNLLAVDIIFLRQNPPFNINYLTSTYFLDFLPKNILILNNPNGIRNNPEKILVNYFQDFVPPTLISNDSKIIEEFIKINNKVVIKPLYSFGGKGVLTFNKNDKNLKSVLEFFLEKNKQNFLIQKFLPEVFKGDIRVLLIDGNFLGSFRRMPHKKDFRSNLLVGGKYINHNINKKQKDICYKISTCLKQIGLFFVGIDIIENYLIEINITSPTGIVSINKNKQIRLEKILWDFLEKKYKNFLLNI